ncbi:MAG: agmatinase family protein [Bacteroidales bacterium]|jgi:agmatinase|nr:agmatinase family protein [Bacteroidales bacterium]
MQTTFDPNAALAPNGNYFGFPFTPEQARLILISVPWDVTTSYKSGTAKGPAAIMDASLQLDFYDEAIPDAWQLGIGTLPLNDSAGILRSSIELRGLLDTDIADSTFRHCERSEKRHNEVSVNDSTFRHCERGEAIRSGAEADSEADDTLETINNACRYLNDWVYETALEWLRKGKKAGIVGGEHSVPLGYLKALSEYHEDFGILHLDAHADLRAGYEGLEFSHASIMYNALQLPQIKRLVQVGIRDVSPEEISYARSQGQRVTQFSDRMLQNAMLEGETWAAQCSKIVGALPEKVYISFDIDALDPSLCPHTGTPVAGGLSFAQARYLLEALRRSGKQIIGFDLCEVAPNPNDSNDEWDGNVGARILYLLSNTTLV